MTGSNIVIGINVLMKHCNVTVTNKPLRKLGEICKIVGGGTPSKSNPMFYEGEIPWSYETVC